MRRFLLSTLTTTGICVLTLGGLAFGPALAHAQNNPDLDKISSSPIPQQDARRADSDEKRFGNLIYTPPAGWKREEVGGILAYIAPNLGSGENVRILVMPGEKADGDLQSAFDRAMSRIRKDLKAQLITPGPPRKDRKGRQNEDVLARTDVVELPSGVRWTCFLCLWRVGDRQESVLEFTSSAELYKQYLPELNRFCSRVRFASLEQDASHRAAARDRVLAPGDPPLTQEMAERFTVFFEWLLDAPMTQEQRDLVQNGLITTWKSGSHKEIDPAVQFIQTQAQIEQKGDAERDLLRAKLQPVLLDALRKKPDDPTAKWVLALYESSHRQIAAGVPPLTRQASDAFMEMLCFMHNQVVGGEPFTTTQEDKDQFAKSLATVYGKCASELQKHIAGAPLLWASLRIEWPTLSDVERGAWKAKFQGYLKNMAPDYLKIVEAPQGVRDGAAAAAIRRQQQHNNYVFLSNMSLMRHASMMNAINNIGGYHPYTYVVR